MKTNREWLVQAVNEYLADEQIDFLVDLINGKIQSKKEMLEHSGYTPEMLNEVDSAYPIAYTHKLCDLIGGENLPTMAYDYNEPNRHGKLINVDRLFLTTMFQLF